jgi:hypothetical protein
MCELTHYKIADDEYLFNDPSHNQDTTESTLCQVEEENEKNLSARAIKPIRQRPPPAI